MGARVFALWKLNTLTGFFFYFSEHPFPRSSPTTTTTTFLHVWFTEQPARQPGCAHSLRSYHTRQPGWSQFDRRRKNSAWSSVPLSLRPGVDAPSLPGPHTGLQSTPITPSHNKFVAPIWPLVFLLLLLLQAVHDIFFMVLLRQMLKV